MIAEDNPVSRRLLEMSLIKAGHEVLCVENGNKALELFKEKFCPIVLTDWMMPGMDGLELCRAIRENQSTGYVFIILLTAKDSKDDIVIGLEAGADDYLTKPIHHAELIARLNTGIRILELERSLKQATEEIKILSITDPLTRCYNRRYLNDHLPKEMKRAKRYGHSLGLILCDIDHFKVINDTYGHQAGDLVLKEFVQFINESIRVPPDWVARYGGEEFIIVTPETDPKAALGIAERICKGISQRTMTWEKKEIRITASFGVTGFHPTASIEGISPEAMMNQADELLYQAKEEGRNRVKAG